MKRLTIHIGTEKTGTTTIQHFCHKNRERLKEQGIIYPEVGFCNFAHFSLVAPLHPIDNDGAKLEFAPNDDYSIEDEWVEIKEIFDKDANAHVLISAEHFSSRLKDAGINKLKEVVSWLGDDINVEIIMLVRRQDHYFQSWYSTHIKAGGVLTIQEAFNMRFNQKWFYDYYYIAEAWANKFGCESIKIAVFEREQLGDGLLSVFSTLAGFKIDGGFEMDVKDDNTSWTPNMLTFARLVNVHNRKSKVDNRYEKLEKMSTWFSDAKRPLISALQRSSLLDRYAEGNANLASKYLGRECGTLFFESSPATEDDWVDVPDLSNLDLAGILINNFKLRWQM